MDMNYREDKEITKEAKKAYAESIEDLIKHRQGEAEQLRTEYFRDVFGNPEKYREDFRKMLGWPLVGHTDESIPTASFEALSEEDGYTIYRARIEVLHGFEMSGLFFKMKGDGAKPLVIVQHGGSGTPELISGMYGTTWNYNDMLMRVVYRGVHVFAPQLLLWNTTDYGVDYDRKRIDSDLKRVGGSVAALELYGISRILDYFEGKDYVSNFGMVGLSYGGFYTLFAAALDTRIKSAISCSFFNKRDACGWSDWTWFASAHLFDDAEVACLVYPRRLCIEVGTRDELFDSRYAEESFERLRAYCEGVGEDWYEFILFDGSHEFCRDDTPIENLVKHLKKG